MFRKDQAVTVDLADPAQPVIVDRSTQGMTTDTVRLELPGLGECLAWSRPEESGLDLYEAASMRPAGPALSPWSAQLEPDPSDGCCADGRAWFDGGRDALGERPPDRDPALFGSARRRGGRLRARAQAEVTEVPELGTHAVVLESEVAP